MRKKTSNPEQLLRSAGLRATRQRVALLGLLAANHALSVEMITRRARGVFDMATAYRMLGVYEEAGLVTKSGPVHGKALYELSRGHHHHAVCVECGAIADVSACLPAALTKKAHAVSGFARIDSHRLEFSGLCKPCAAKRR